MHIIGGWEYNNHIIFDINTNKYEIIHTFANFTSMFAPACVYLKSKNSILLIGGAVDIGEAMNIRIYSLETKKWRKIPNIDLKEMYHIQYYLASDEKYMVFKALFETSSGYSVNIGHKLFILEIGETDNDYKLIESKLTFCV